MPERPSTTPQKAIKYTMQALEKPAMRYDAPASPCKALAMLKATTYIPMQ